MPQLVNDDMTLSENIKRGVSSVVVGINTNRIACIYFTNFVYVAFY